MSNIVVMYGYGFDGVNKIDEEKIEKNLPKGMTIQTAYSVSPYEPECFAIGVQIQDICMFSPVELENTLTPEDQATVDNWQIPADLLKLVETNKTKPTFFVFGYSDD